MASNYDKMAQAARELFLTFDQEEIIARWNLAHDGEYLYLAYFGEPLRLSRRTAELSARSGAPCLTRFNNATMVVFDLLTHAKARPRASGEWASISRLGGFIGAGHDQALSNRPLAAKLSRDLPALDRACRALGGVPMGKADVSFAIPVFEDFAIWFQFWEGDDEFPHSVKYLFDANALQYMHYETLWYAMGDLADRLLALTGQA